MPTLTADSPARAAAATQAGAILRAGEALGYLEAGAEQTASRRIERPSTRSKGPQNSAEERRAQGSSRRQLGPACVHSPVTHADARPREQMSVQEAS